MLQKLREISSKIIVVVNGIVNEEGKQTFIQYADRIIIRDNIGNDGGAYADVCVRYLGKDGMAEYDEIVFCNDTFFGPFVSFEKVFQKMENSKADFWGLNVIENGFWSFLESYFLVFRRQIIEDESLYIFCDKLCEGISKNSDYSYYMFELGIYHYLVNKKYQPGYYTNTQNASVYLNPDICISQYGLPILKKKSFSPAMYEEERQIFTLKYIQEYCQYDIREIIDCVKRKYDISIEQVQIQNYNWALYRPKISEFYVPLTKLTDAQIQDFLNTKNTVYIYGAGVYAKVIWYLYQDYIRKFGGFVISDEKCVKSDIFCGKKVVKFSEIESNARIILGLNKEHTKEVSMKLGESKNVLVLWQ